ncbi:MAG: ferritin-like domain-containing protein [Bryobacteraceae bacterium]
MSNSATVAKEISRENKETSPVVAQLQRQVANSFILYANYKHYHWQVSGPLFRDLHKLFDEFAAEILDSLDPFAERLRMIGQDPVFAPNDLTRLANVAVAARNGNMRQMVEEARTNAITVIKDMREGARLADKADDPGTVDLFSRMVQIHEKQEWWLRDILERGDGLSS